MKTNLQVKAGACGVVAFFLLATSVTAETACRYNNRDYSSGSSVCECPSLSSQTIDENFRMGRIKSRRLICNGGAWENLEETCFDLKFGSVKQFTDALNRFSQDLCPAATGAEVKS